MKTQSFRAKLLGRSTFMLASAVVVAAWAGVAAAATPGGDWIGTWAASAQPIWDADFPVPLNMPRNLWNQTVRQIARVSVGGKSVRVVLSNEYGDRPLVIGAALFGVGWGMSGICPGPAMALIAFLPSNLWLFLAAMFVGSYLGSFIMTRRGPQLAPAPAE